MTDKEPARPDALCEDLADLAAYEFRTAQELCADCRLYHSVWGYERLARVKSHGFESERDILGPLFRHHTPQAGRIMIGGAADAGLLALTAQETRCREPRITVVDRCATPLAVCRHYARSCGLTVATAKADLTREPLAASQDLAFVHNILLHLPLHLWSAFLRNIRLSLGRGGILILVHRLRPAKLGAEHRPSPTAYAAQTLAALSERRIALPEDEASFGRRLADYAEKCRPPIEHSWPGSIGGHDYLQTRLIEAGFAIAQRIDHYRRRIVPSGDSGEVTPMPTHVFVATNVQP